MLILQLEFPQKCKVPVDKLKKLILCVRSCMFDNPYHNWIHAFDVTQVRVGRCLNVCVHACVYLCTLVLGTLSAILFKIHRFVSIRPIYVQVRAHVFILVLVCGRKDISLLQLSNVLLPFCT